MRERKISKKKKKKKEKEKRKEEDEEEEVRKRKGKYVKRGELRHLCEFLNLDARKG